MQPADEEAVDADQLARPPGLDVWLGLGLARRRKRGAVASHQRKPLGARVQTVPDQGLVDPVGTDLKATPFRARQARRDAPRTEPGMAQRERYYPLLDHHRELVRHLRTPALPRPEHLQPRPLDLPLPAVIGRAMHPEDTTRMRDRRTRREIKQLQAIAEQHVILRHAALLHSLWR